MREEEVNSKKEEERFGNSWGNGKNLRQNRYI